MLKSNKGSALAVALIFMVIMLIIGGALLFLSETGVRQSRAISDAAASHYEIQSAARIVAEVVTQKIDTSKFVVRRENSDRPLYGLDFIIDDMSIDLLDQVDNYLLELSNSTLAFFDGVDIHGQTLSDLSIEISNLDDAITSGVSTADQHMVSNSLTNSSLYNPVVYVKDPVFVISSTIGGTTVSVGYTFESVIEASSQPLPSAVVDLWGSGVVTQFFNEEDLVYGVDSAEEKDARYIEMYSLLDSFFYDTKQNVDSLVIDTTSEFVVTPIAGTSIKMSEVEPLCRNNSSRSVRIAGDLVWDTNTSYIQELIVDGVITITQQVSAPILKTVVIHNSFSEQYALTFKSDAALNPATETSSNKPAHSITTFVINGGVLIECGELQSAYLPVQPEINWSVFYCQKGNIDVQGDGGQGFSTNSIYIAEDGTLQALSTAFQISSNFGLPQFYLARSAQLPEYGVSPQFVGMYFCREDLRISDLVYDGSFTGFVFAREFIGRQMPLDYPSLEVLRATIPYGLYTHLHSGVDTIYSDQVIIETPVLYKLISATMYQIR